MFAAVWIKKFAHAQRHREPLAELLKNWADDSPGTGSKQEPVLDSHPYAHLHVHRQKQTTLL